MESKADYKLRLKSELSEVGKEIEKLIVNTDKVSLEIKQDFDKLENALLAKQSLTQAKLKELLMPGDEVWSLIWDNVWDVVNESNHEAASKINHDYKELEPALRAKQSALQRQLHESKIPGDEVWNEVWTEVWTDFWGVVDEVDRKAATKIKQAGEELKSLAIKQSVLQAKLHEVLMSGDDVWNVVKEVSNAMSK